MGLDEYSKILDLMKSDYVHGASWYYEQAARAVLELGTLDEARLEELLEVRPGMASVVNVIRAYRRGVSRGLEIREVYERLINYRQAAVEGLRNNRLDVSSVITISSSSAVKEVLSVTKPLKVYILESRPGEEYRELYEGLKGVASEVIVVPDSSMAHFLKYVDAVIVGADGVYTSGHLVNKTGTMPLACVGHALGKQVIAVAESFKFIDGFPPPAHAFVDYGGAKVPLLEPVPLDLFSYIVTDTGLVEQASGERISEISELFINAITK